MKMKKVMVLFMTVSLLLAGCAQGKAEDSSNAASAQPQVSEVTAEQEVVEEVVEETAEQAVEARTIYPLPDNTMENLTDAILAVSLEEGDAYVDDAGIMQMEVKIYTYDKYDMVDIAMLNVGDTIVRQSGEVEVTSKEQTPAGLIFINGGQEEGGFDLFTDDSGVFFETGFNDAKSWYEVGEATIRVSVDFTGTDNADPDQGEVIFYPGSFLVGEVKDYNFTPYNTTIRVEDGQVVEMNRRYTP